MVLGEDRDGDRGDIGLGRAQGQSFGAERDEDRDRVRELEGPGLG